MKDLPYEEAKKQYQKQLYSSTYGSTYGRKNVVYKGDVKILKYKKISQLRHAECLNSLAKNYLDSWVALGETDYYVSRSTAVLRTLYTGLKVQEKPRSTNQEHYAWIHEHDRFKNQRFDLVNSGVSPAPPTAQPRARRISQLALKNDLAVLKELTQPPKPPMKEYDYTAERKKLLLRGNGNITGFFDPVDGKVSSY